MTKRVKRKCITVVQFDLYWLHFHTYARTLTTSESSDSVRNAGALAVFRRPDVGSLTEMNRVARLQNERPKKTLDFEETTD